MTADFLTGRLADGLLAVEVAWGADLTADPATWVWTDITGDVRHNAGVDITIGRGNEAAEPQPATCNLVLDNTAGGYSLGGQSPNWPNVRRNTPVRVRVSLNGGGVWTTRFFGYAAAWVPKWDSTGRDATTELEAAGVTRRLAQGSAPVMSTLRRSVLARVAAGVGIRAYWPCEDPRGATSVAPGLSTHSAMTIAGTAELPYPKWQESAEDFVCSAALPEMNGTTWRGVVPVHAATGEAQVRMLIGIPEDGAAAAEATLFTVYTTGTIARWDVRYIPGGNLRLAAYDTSGTQLLSSSINFNSDNTVRRTSLQLTQDGGDVDYLIATVATGVFSGGGGQATGTITGETVGRVTAVAINPSGLLTDTVIGHITVEDVVTGVYSDQPDFNGRLGEGTGGRLTRLCSENGLQLQTVGASSGAMGPQTVSPLLTLIREVETNNGGVVHDGLHAGLTYVTYAARATEAAVMTLSAPGGDLARALEPVDDDQAIRNRVTVKSVRGTEVTAEDVDGPLGTAAVGVYDTSVDVSAFYDAHVEALAGWRLNLGTVEGYRHPRLQLNLARDPALAAGWLAISLASRIDVTGIAAIRPQHPAGDVTLIVEGWREHLDQHRWDVTANCAPYGPWRAGLVAAPTGDTGAFVLRAADNGSSTLAAGAAAGATSLSVATPAGNPRWTTVADDVPLQIEVGGIVVTVTAISGASSPQTFTVTGATVTKALASGLPVQLYRPNLVSMHGV